MSYSEAPTAWMHEFEALRATPLPVAEKYAAYQALLDRLSLVLTAPLHADYSNLYARLLALRRHRGLDTRDVDALRRRARLVLGGGGVPSAEQLQADEAALKRFLRQAMGGRTEALPGLQAPRWAAGAPSSPGETPTFFRQLRVVVTGVTEAGVSVSAADADVAARLCTDAFPHLPAMLSVGSTLSLVDVQLKEGCARARLIVYEPDYLVDVSALTACFQPYGHHPFNYLIDRFRPHESSVAQLLGQAADRFVDACLHAPDVPPDTLFLQAIRQSFRERLLSYLALSEEIGADFFHTARCHFDHLWTTIHRTFAQPDVGLRREEMLVEPSFVCPALGLRGRLDMMSADRTCVVEQKSGRADDFGHAPHPRRAHALQMALYKELLHCHFGLPLGRIRSYLLYSRYPLFYDEPVPLAQVQEAIDLRNRIVHNEERIRRGKWPELLRALTVEKLNTRHLNGRFFTAHLRPRLARVVDALHTPDAVAADYFDGFLTFLAREQYLAKVGDRRPGSSRGFALSWTQERSLRRGAGDLVEGMRLSGPPPQRPDGPWRFCFNPQGLPPNFSAGEMVQIYRTDGPESRLDNTQALRAVIESVSADSVSLLLCDIQHSDEALPPGATFAMEHDYSDAVFATCYRGLFGLLTAPEHRRALFLGRREPQRDEEVTLAGHYLGDATDKLVLRAKQAQDYFLLSGPPGCGKTNVLLRAMVSEFLLTHSSDGACLLLTAYTNRAVDEVCSMLEGLQPAPPFVRLGRPQATAPGHRAHLLEAVMADLERRSDMLRRLSDIRIVVGTVAGLSGQPELFRLKTFHTAIVDEASQLLEPQLAGLLFATNAQGECAIGRFVFIGDAKQLPAVVCQAPSEAMVRSPRLQAIGMRSFGESLFQRLQRQLRQSGRTDLCGQVKVQGRMHPDVARFANHHFYGGCLRPVPLPHQIGALELRAAGTDAFESFLASTRLGFVGVTPAPGYASGKTNPAEAEALASATRLLLTLYARSPRPIRTADVGIIVPFRGQIALVRHALQGIDGADDITVDTVECYQGSQREVILFGTTVSRPLQLDMLSSLQEEDDGPIDRKLNVALTRARRQCFLFGHADTLRRHPIYRAFIDEQPGFFLPSPTPGG